MVEVGQFIEKELDDGTFFFCNDGVTEAERFS